MPYSAPPLRTALADTFPSPSNATFKTGVGALWDFVTGMLGLTGNPEDAFDALKMHGVEGLWNLRLHFSVAASALTATLKANDSTSLGTANPAYSVHRSATVGSGQVNRRKHVADIATVISSGSTAGHASTVEGYLYWYLLDQGTGELAWSSKYFGKTGIFSTTAEGGAGAADDGYTMYSTTARSNVPGRLVAITKDTQTVAGTWAAVPTEVQPGPLEAVFPLSNGIQVLTDGATITAPNGAKHKAWEVTLGGTGRTLLSPIGLVEGESYTQFVIQDGTGSRTITTYGAAWFFPGGVKPVLSTGAGKVDIITGVVRGGKIHCGFLPDER